MKIIKRLFYKLFPRYVVLESRHVSYGQADAMIETTAGLDERERWIIDTSREDYNMPPTGVYLCRRARIRIK